MERKTKDYRFRVTAVHASYQQVHGDPALTFEYRLEFRKVLGSPRYHSTSYNSIDFPGDIMRVENLFTVARNRQPTPVAVFTVQGDCVPYVYLLERKRESLHSSFERKAGKGWTWVLGRLQ